MQRHDVPQPFTFHVSRNGDGHFEYPGPALLMTVRREIAQSRCETGMWSPEDLRRTRAVRRRSKGRACLPKACRSSESAIVVEAFMNNAG